ncbi:MBL fold metallo-hydrolase [Rhizobium laguerreae]|uniref:MBL fold metallo-hydrolase n=1 Tax=Rhizobium laguerreae TaxID=1076926 RepID=UPI001C91FD5C|nr:MBL fold metallo-hydrolase [Rhizobium laguerreae]MBY3205094.1 MBL fold metallo-hydrolase [Rhizobium laguerreae]MBY3416268.1 MBL fold metallo-hydrolase [Rhizobium laguerreae]
MVNQLPLSETDLAPTQKSADGTNVIAADLAYRTMSIVNVVFYGDPMGPEPWVLIDTGLSTSADKIKACASLRFGDARPAAIVMTHAHFDHAGSVESLASFWEVPVFAHPLERPYLEGQASYPPADPMAGGGAMTLLSPLYPRSPVDVRPWLKILPADQTVPGMSGWKWIHTPGHSPGHISLWRESDRTLISGDAIITTGQESAYEAIVQTPEMHGPPRYFTPDWEEAEKSVALVASLEPELIISGHGLPVKGQNARDKLHRLAKSFRDIAVPKGGRYDLDPAKPGKSGDDAFR